MKPTTRKGFFMATVIALTKSTAAAPIDNGFENDHLYQPYGSGVLPYTITPSGTSGTSATAPPQPSGAVPSGAVPTGASLTESSPLSTTVPYPTSNGTSPITMTGPSSGFPVTPTPITLTALTTSTTTTPASPTGTGTSSSDACANVADGALVCNGEDYYGLCNHGSVIWQPVANGTACENGSITWASWYPGNPANQFTSASTS